jgi:hypothetical protein
MNKVILTQKVILVSIDYSFLNIKPTMNSKQDSTAFVQKKSMKLTWMHDKKSYRLINTHFFYHL